MFFRCHSLVPRISFSLHNQSKSWRRKSFWEKFHCELFCFLLSCEGGRVWGSTIGMWIISRRRWKIIFSLNLFDGWIISMNKWYQAVSQTISQNLYFTYNRSKSIEHKIMSGCQKTYILVIYLMYTITILIFECTTCQR